MTKENPKEADVKAAIKRLLVKYGWWTWMPVAAHGFGANGASDHHALRKDRRGFGCFLAIEAKFDAKKGTPLQEKFGANVMENGGFYRVVNWGHIQTGEFEKWLAALTARLDNVA